MTDMKLYRASAEGRRRPYPKRLELACPGIPDRSASQHRRAIEEALNHHHLYQPTAVSDNFTPPGHSIRDI